MKVKWNGMDTVIGILLLAVLVAGVFFVAGGNENGLASTGTQNVTAEFVVELTSQEEAFTTLPQVGDVVHLGEKEKVETVVTGVEVLPAVSLGYNTQDGWVREVSVPERYDLRITLQAEATETEQAIKIKEALIRVGMGVALKHKNWAGYGFVLALNTI